MDLANRRVTIATASLFARLGARPGLALYMVSGARIGGHTAEVERISLAAVSAHARPAAVTTRVSGFGLPPSSVSAAMTEKTAEGQQRERGRNKTCPPLMMKIAAASTRPQRAKRLALSAPR